jgi:hypothetical protein
MGLSVGFDRIRERSGTEADDKVLDRRTAPDFLKAMPINELVAIEEARFWESSTVTFGGLATAKPDVIHSAVGDHTLAALLAGLKDGTLSDEQMALVRELVAAHAQHAAAGSDHGTRPDQARPDMRHVMAVVAAQHARLVAQGIAA